MKALYFLSGFAGGFVVGALVMRGYMEKNDVSGITTMKNIEEEVKKDEELYNELRSRYNPSYDDSLNKSIHEGIKEAMEELDDPDLNKFMAERESPEEDDLVNRIDEEEWDAQWEDEYERMFFTFSINRKALFDEDYEEINAREYLSYYADVLPGYEHNDTVYLVNESKKILMAIDIFAEEEQWETL